MINPSDELAKLKAEIENALVQAGFSLQNFSIEIEDDAHHVAHIKVIIEPELLKDPEEKQVDDAFNDIVKGLE